MYLVVVVGFKISAGRKTTQREKLGSSGGGSPQNCRWGCDVRVFKSRRYFRPKHGIFHTFIRSRGSLENHTRFQTIMVIIISVF